MQITLTNLGTVTPDEAEETLQTVTDFLKGLNLEKLITLLLLLAGCLVVMKLVLRLTDRAFLRLELERSLHTFKAGDYVEAGGISGTVQEVGLAYTKLCTVDNKVISVPNGQISGEKIINYSTEERRRVDLTFNASYDSPLQQVTGVLRAVVAAHPMALAEPEPFVRVNAYRDSSIEYVVRVWCATGDYWTLYYDLLEQVKEAFDQNGIEMTYNHLNVHLMERERSEP